MRTERELAHVLGHERELELSSHFGSRDELNEERVQILASDSERELAHIFHELLMLWAKNMAFTRIFTIGCILPYLHPNLFAIAKMNTAKV